ncbi:hypothetical protein KI387_033509 [Taxus chinensis]|uniref:X8 domain-containing protein n=1 Tax=Taxus chinensis TaxID=29808 RepID=A0AA38F5V3_TAXCH|nr:hypothetical protein KI387_033509 [Taxus chinensis]
MIAETRWPSNGGPKELAATPDNATNYNANLIRHMINNTWTPSRLGQEIDTYIFSNFNKNIKLGMESERNWGLFYLDETKVYNVDITTGFPYLAIGGTLKSFDGATWCISSSFANETDIQKALDWAYGSGSVDCSPIQPSQPCSLPNSLSSHASYAFKNYDKKNGHSSMACNFDGTRNITTNNPSDAPCNVARGLTFLVRHSLPHGHDNGQQWGDYCISRSQCRSHSRAHRSACRLPIRWGAASPPLPRARGWGSPPPGPPTTFSRDGWSLPPPPDKLSRLALAISPSHAHAELDIKEGEHDDNKEGKHDGFRFR